jgi:hypothetical protein
MLLVYVYSISAYLMLLTAFLVAFFCVVDLDMFVFAGAVAQSLAIGQRGYSWYGFS